MTPPSASSAADERALRAWGIDPSYVNVFHRRQVTDPAVALALRRAMGADPEADPSDGPPAGTPLVVLRPGDEPVPVSDLLGTGHGGELVLEDGTRIDVQPGDVVPIDLPFGYHRIEAEPPAALVGDGVVAANVIVSPGRCPLPPDLRTWGVVAQLYAARSRSSWGIGDFADLRSIVSWATARGAGVVGLNPLHAPTPAGPTLDSPYSPSSRRWRNPMYLAIEAVPGAADLPDLDDLRAAGQALNDGNRIDRGAAWALKRSALDTLWERFGGDVGFDRYQRELGPDLVAWATFCALADHHGGGWRTWPAEFRQPDGPAVARFAADHPGQVGFWAWLQWLVDEQLASSGAGDVAIADLAVGIDGDGADAWQWQSLLADGVAVGAPPDLLGHEGQNWGLPPFVPWKLRDAGYQPLAATIRANLRHARGLRIDHVMGLFRLFWIPDGRTGADGAYVRFAGRELLDVVALESHRAGGLVVGEDLGTVEEGVRDRLAEAGLLSTRLLWFEDEPPAQWPAQAMAAVTTHDLATIAGTWTGTDLADERAAGIAVDDIHDTEMRARLRQVAVVTEDATAADVTVAVHRALAGAPSMIVTATLDDLLGAEHRPNLPGTIDQHPNWRIPLPVPLDDLAGHPVAEAVASALGAGRAP